MSSMRLSSVLIAAFAVAGTSTPVGAQAPRVERPFEAAAAGEDRVARATHPGLAFLASAAVPGAGQFLLGNERWVPYLAVEIWAWRSAVDQRRTAHSLADQYRDIAWSVARRVSLGERRDTAWEYYETMTRFPASGMYDRNPGTPDLQPETTPNTYNGFVWNLARALFLPPGVSATPGSPAYERALDYYRRHAVPPEFAWAWGDNILERELFRSLIAQSDAAYRRSTRVLGFILANHIISAIDALIAARLRAAGVEAAPFRIRGGLEEIDGAGVRWSATVTFTR